MAGSIGTNVLADEQQYAKVLEQIFSFCEQKYLRNDENKKRSALMGALRTHLKMNGKIAYTVIPAQFKDKVIEMIEDQNIPYMVMPDGHGNVMVVTKDSDGDRLLQIQKDVEFLSTDYVKELTPQNMLSIYKAHGIKNVDTLNFKNSDMAEIAKQKLYQSGVPFAEIKGKDSTQLIISPMGKFSRDGNDLAFFELHHAFEQSKADDLFAREKGTLGSDFLDTRFAQAKYDKTQLAKFAEKAVEKESFVLCSSIGSQTVCIESGPMGVFVLENKGEKGGWSSTPLDIGPDATPKDIESLISKYADKVHNMTVVSSHEFEKFKDGFLKEDSTTGKTYLSSSVSNEVVNITSRRPKNDFLSKDVKILSTISSTEVDSMLKAINMEASKRTSALIGDKVVSQEKAYGMKKDIMLGIMTEKELPEIKEFLEGNKGIDSAAREEWYENIFSHFENTKEDTEYSCDLNKTSVKDMVSTLTKGLDNVIDIDKDEINETYE